MRTALLRCSCPPSVFTPLARPPSVRPCAESCCCSPAISPPLLATAAPLVPRWCCGDPHRRRRSGGTPVLLILPGPRLCRRVTVLSHCWFQYCAVSLACWPPSLSSLTRPPAMLILLPPVLQSRAAGHPGLAGLSSLAASLTRPPVMLTHASITGQLLHSPRPPVCRHALPASVLHSPASAPAGSSVATIRIIITILVGPVSACFTRPGSPRRRQSSARSPGFAVRSPRSPMLSS